ncbi:TPA: hypothetical protein ACSP2M_004323, partial [Aeromonas hydrophila]
MAELRIEKPTVMTQLEGTVFVIHDDGTVVRARAGVLLQPGDRILSGEGGGYQLADTVELAHQEEAAVEVASSIAQPAEPTSGGDSEL